jgi:hypothetical protein
MTVKLAQKVMQIDSGFLHGDAKTGREQGTLTEYIAFRQPADLSFVDRVHRLVPVRGESPHFGRQFSNSPCIHAQICVYKLTLPRCRPSFPRPRGRFPPPPGAHRSPQSIPALDRLRKRPEQTPPGHRPQAARPHPVQRSAGYFLQRGKVFDVPTSLEVV